MGVLILTNNTGAKLVNADQQAVAVVSDTLAYDVEGAQFSAGFKAGAWNGKKTFLRFPELIFEAGFVPMVRAALAEAGIPVSVRDQRTVIEALGPKIGEPTSYDELGYPQYGGYLEGIELRDFQADAVEVAVEMKRGIVQIATGGGKTETAIAITKRIQRRTLFLTHKLDLVRQTRARYASRLGRAVGMISEGEWMPADISVATVQTIMAQFKSDPQKVIDYLATIEVLIVDEAHRSSADQFFKVISACVNAFFRFSLTATALMKGNREDDLKMIACSGNMISRVTNGDLIARGILAQPYFRFHEVPAFKMPDGRSPNRADYQAAYKTGIVENLVRNQMIVDDAITQVAEGRRGVILVKEIQHGDLLIAKLKLYGMRCAWVAGKDSADKREAALNGLRENTLDVLVASTILDEGLDCDAISFIILAGGGKSKISLFQRVGRSVRKKKGDELAKIGNTAKIIDYIDTGDKRLMKHSALRFAAVKAEEGWIIEGIERWSERQKRVDTLLRAVA